MYFLLYGEDGFRARRALQAAQAKFKETRDVSGFNVVRLRQSDGLTRAQEELFASPFLAERKLVILEGYCGLTKADQEQLAESIDRKPDTTVAIFFEDGGAKDLDKSPLYKVLAKQKFTTEHKALSPAEASRLAEQEAEAEGQQFEPAALRKLIEAIGSDSWRIHQETKKLAALASGQKRKTIAAEDVEQMVSGSREQTVFSYLDACTDGKGTSAMAALENLMASGESELMIISMLQRHFKLLILTKDLKQRGLSEKTAADKLAVHPFVAKKAWRTSDRFELPFLIDCIEQLAQMEQDLKTGRSRPRVTLDIFTTRMIKQVC